jgi:hypothetical protein
VESRTTARTTTTTTETDVMIAVRCRRRIRSARRFCWFSSLRLAASRRTWLVVTDNSLTSAERRQDSERP